VAAIGDILAYGRWAGAPDAEKTWILKTRRLHPALYPLGHRRKLPTGADDKHYAFVCTAPDGSERILVVLNFQSAPQTAEVDTRGLFALGFVGLRHNEFIEYHNPLRLELNAYGYCFYQVVPASRSRE
jgi:hypothetical protein